MINNFELKARGHYRGLGLVFDILIDGRSLLETITQFEQRFDGPAGAYTPGLAAVDISHFSCVNEAYITPYVCACGEWECWYLSCKIGMVDDFVYWHQFKNDWRSDKSKAALGLYWSYKDMPGIVFEKQAYVAEINRAKQLIRQDSASQEALRWYQRQIENR